jgi:8-oxo-dGTP pyrophosphatase MutT (NUDIX family)
LGELGKIREVFAHSGFGSKDEISEWPKSDEPGVRSAAVLVPLINHPKKATILLTKRSSSLPDHAGQVAFPGGQIESRDVYPEDTALREAQEEVGLDPSKIELIGRLSPRQTGTGFHVIPVVGILQPPLNLKADPAEVDVMFEVPLSELAREANFSLENVCNNGNKRSYWVLKHDSFFIWGLTARILKEFSGLLRLL